MTVENYPADAGPIATLAGILAGFAISAVIQLLTVHAEGRIVTATIVTFSASSAMFLYALIVFVLAFAATAEQSTIIDSLDTMGAVALLVLFGVVFVLVGGIGRAGWKRSRTTGILTTRFVVTTMCLTAVVIVQVISGFE
jgi:hypothetical protein